MKQRMTLNSGFPDSFLKFRDDRMSHRIGLIRNISKCLRPVGVREHAALSFLQCKEVVLM